MINNQLSCTNTNEINEDYEQYLTDIRFMKEAYNLALKADKKNETPIGCVIVHNNKIIAMVITEEIRIIAQLSTLKYLQ